MKSILLKILKIFLILTAVFLVILLVFGLTLILKWPWWVGGYILLGLVGLGLAFLFFRKIWRKRREQSFITQVINQDDHYLKQMGDKEKQSSRELQDRWKEAIIALRRSHLKKYGNPLYVLPWYLVIGESGSGKTTAIESADLSSPFAETQRISGISGTRNCDWWFFEQAILIDTAGRFAIPVDEGRDKDEWQKFLTLLAKYRKKEPLNGLVVTVSADKLLEQGPDVLENDGKRIRRRIDELMAILGAKFPIYVLVTKCDLIQGMNQFCDRLSEKGLAQAMGVINENRDRKVETGTFLDRVIGIVGDRLRDYRLLVFSKPPTGDAYLAASQGTDPALLLFPEEFERLKPGLTAFVNGAFKEIIYQESPFLRGVYFSSGRQEGTPYSHFLRELNLIAEKEVLPGTNRGLFLHDFFSRILPRDRGLFVVTQQALHWRRLTKNLGLMAWLAVGIAVCGLLSYSFVKNLRLLREASASFEKPLITSITREDVYEKMLRLTGHQEKIAEIVEQNRSWWIPQFGLHQSKEVEEGLKLNFCNQFRDGIIHPLDEWLNNIAARFTHNTSDEVMSAFIAHLVRRINLLKSSRQEGGLATLHEKPQPKYIQTSAQTNPAIVTDIEEKFGGLYLNYLRWRSEPGEIDEEALRLQKLLNFLVTERRRNLHWLVAWVNDQDSLSPVVMQDFWTGADFASKPPAVAPAFTGPGKKQIDAFILELESALPSGSPQIARQKLEFQTWYRDSYLQAWHEFSVAFGTGAAGLQDPDARRQMADQMGTEQNPYFSLLETTAAECKPLVEQTAEMPAWIRQVFVFQGLRREAALLPQGPAKTPGIIKKTASKVKAGIAKLERQTGLEAESYWNPEEKLIATRTLADYQQSLTQVAQSTTPREEAYRAAVTLSTADPDRSDSPYFAAQRAVKKLKIAMPAAESDPKIFWQLVGGPLDFFRAYLSEEAACHLQALWEREVLWQVRSAPDGYEKIQRLVGKGGYAKQFVEQGAAAPFIDIELKKGYSAKSVAGFSLPFETGFFVFLNEGVDLPERRKDNYAVTIRGLPTRANSDARVLPKATRLELHCGDKMYRLINRHYPVKKTFNWSRHDCGDVRLQIMIDNLVLTKNYRGSQSFAEFLRDFAKGLRQFTLKDFPREAPELERYGIRFIEVRYKLSGHDEIINPPGPSLDSVPQRIVRCGSP